MKDTNKDEFFWSKVSFLDSNYALISNNCLTNYSMVRRGSINEKEDLTLKLKMIKESND